ncbi:MAG: hypothetical protein LH609_06715 [Rudanella sp.]|nr:hypothetical protein [Rudanella sp.]
MKAYNPTHIRNRTIRQQADRWQREGLLQTDQLNAIRQAYPVPFRGSNIFAEIGAFIFTGIAVGGAYALIMLFMTGLLDNSVSFGAFNALVSLGLIVLVYTLIRRYNFYRNGPDNVLIVLAASFLLTALNVVLPNDTGLWFRCLLAGPVLLAFAAYYGDVIVTFMAVLAFYAAIFTGLLELSWGRAVLPFVLMGVSLGLWLLIKQTQTRLTDSNQTYYADALSMAGWLSLIVLATAGNYFVVRELNGLLAEIEPGQLRPAAVPQISLAWLFWLLTFLIPGIYAYIGFTRKDRMFVVLGILGFAAATSTVRYYYALLPLSIHITLVGIALIGGSVLVIRYLRQPRFGFTDVPDEESPRQFFLNAETMGIMSVTGATMNRQPDMKFGGGEFGGGGADGRY